MTLFCYNACAIEKLRPLATEKSAKSHWFKNLQNLPYDYYSNDHTWMTKDLVFKWFRRLNEQISKMKRKSAANLVTAIFSNIKVEFFPANCISIMQLLDQGIGENVKVEFSVATSRKKSCSLKKSNFRNCKGGRETSNWNMGCLAKCMYHHLPQLNTTVENWPCTFNKWNKQTNKKGRRA